MAGYEVGGEGVSKDFFGAVYQQEAEQMGMSGLQYATLVREEKKWQKENPETRMLVSPMEVAREQNAQLKADLKMDDKEFADLMKRQSQYATQLEAAARDSSIVISKSSPVALAQMQAGMMMQQTTPMLSAADFGK